MHQASATDDGWTNAGSATTSPAGSGAFAHSVAAGDGGCTNAEMICTVGVEWHL